MNSLLCAAPIAAATLARYWLGALDALGEAQVDEHLLGCEECTETLQGLIGLRAGIGTPVRRGVWGSTRCLYRARRLPSEAERRVFNLFAFDVARVGKLLSQTKHPDLGVGLPLDLGKSEQVELVLLSLRLAAKDHLRRGEDLLALLKRIDAMLDASGGRSSQSTVDAGLSLLRAIARAELLQEESRQRYPQHVALRETTDTATAALARGFVTRFGAHLPRELQRAFPRFAAARRMTATRYRGSAILPRAWSVQG
jgi:hypothetical protein